MVDKSKVGLTTQPATMPLERGKIREFAKACQSADPAYVDDATPPVPPTFLTTVNFWMGSGTSPLAQLDIDLRRLLRGGPPARCGRPPAQNPPPAPQDTRQPRGRATITGAVPSRMRGHPAALITVTASPRRRMLQARQTSVTSGQN